MPDDKGKAAGELAAAKDIADLAVLAAVPKRVTVYTWDKATEGEEKQIPRRIRVAPMTVDISAEFAAGLRAILEAMGPEISIGMIPQMIAEHSESTKAIVAIATEETAEYLGSLPYDQFALLTRTVWEVNHDFFVLRVNPIVTDLFGKMFDGLGLTLSTSLPNTEPTP